MMFDFSKPVFMRDSRGNRVEEHEWTKHPDFEWRRLYFRGPEEAAMQVQLTFGDRCVPRGVGPRRVSKFTHCYEFYEGKPTEAVRLIELLERVVTLPQRPYLDAALALDWYKVPDPNVDSELWQNTPAGELNSRAKYWTRGPERMRARRQLVQEHLDVIDEHPLLRQAMTIVSVPGHAGDGSGFGEQLAQRVALAAGKQFVATECPTGPRAQAKEGRALDDVRFRMPFVLEGDVIVFDDVWRSGGSMMKAATAGRMAGAHRVFGLVTVRTLRS